MKPHNRRRAGVIVLSVLALAVAGGCVAPKSEERVAQLQLDAITRLAQSYAMDLSAMRALALSLLDIQTQSARSGVEEAILSRYISPTGQADGSALDAALSAPMTETPADPLVAEVRLGAMTSQQAHHWLEDFALAWRMNSGVDIRSDLISQLSPMRSLAGARSELLDALDAHGASVAAVFRDALSSSQALAQARALERELLQPTQGALRQLWTSRVLKNVRDPARRALLENLFAGVAPSLTLASNPTTNTEPSP